MGYSEPTRSALVRDDATGFERAATAVGGVSVAGLLLSLAAVLQWARIDDRFAGVQVATLLGAVLAVAGVGVLALGTLSRLRYADTNPGESVGAGGGLAFGALSFVAAGLVASQTLGFGTVGWLAASVAAAAATTALVVLPREDVGSTFAPGLFAVALGGVLLGGVVAPGWQWVPANLTGGFTAEVAVPGFAVLGTVLTSWASAKAVRGFGVRGREMGAYLLLYATAAGMLTVLVFVVALVVEKGFGPVFQQFSLANLEWPFVQNGYSLAPETVNGVWPAIVGTVWLVVGATLFAVPLGVGAAVFLTEYAERGRFTQVVEVATNALWSTPSVVFGLFGWVFLRPRIANDTTLLSGMLVLGFMLLPLVLITSREAVKSVPDEYRDASAALGVSQWKTIRSVVLPAAMPGVITGVILGIGRIAGETAPLVLVLGGDLQASKAVDVLGKFKFTASPPFVANPALTADSAALPVRIWAIISHGVSGSPAMGWGTAFVLLLVVMAFYAVGIASRTYFRRKLNYE